MSEQYLSTSRLSNVIRLIALGRQTGLLVVARGQGPSREEGEIQFIDGQVAMATVGQISGSAALAVLQNWGETSYMFLDGVNRLQGFPTTDNLGWGGPPPVTSGSLPPMGSGSFPPGGYAPGPPTYGGQNGYGGSQPGGMPPGTRPGPTPPPNWQNYPPQQPPQQPPPAYGYGRSTSRHVSQRLYEPGYIPRRLTNINPAEATSLDRRERQLLLLVDGRRTIADLVRLTRRGDEEIRYILAHLIALGLVE
jgi:hypothetical protein